MKQLLLKYTSLLLAGELILWWAFYLSPFDIPEYIPFTPINIHGVVLVGLQLAILIAAQKKTLKLQPEVTIIRLTFIGTIIVFISEVVFQTVRQPTLNTHTIDDRLHYFLLGVIGLTIFGTVLSFLTAYQLKTRNTSRLVVMIIVFIIIANLIQYFFPTLVK